MTYKKQIEHLIVDHGLIITDPSKAEEILKCVNYYRLSAYGIGLIDKSTDRYREGISIEHLFSLYRFDSRLRNIISPVIEFVEIKLRSIIAYHLAVNYGSECYRNRAYFHPWTSGVTGKDMFEVFNDNVDREITKRHLPSMTSWKRRSQDAITRRDNLLHSSTIWKRLRLPWRNGTVRCGRCC